MTNSQLAQQLNAHVAQWLNNQTAGTFDLDGIEIRLVYDGAYRVLCEGVEVAVNDNARDFRSVGDFLFNNNDQQVAWLEAAE